MDILNQMIARAKANPQRIVLPEGDEPRTLEAANILLKDKIAQLILIGDPEKIKSMAAEKGYEYIKEAKIVDPIHDPKMPEYANLLFELRKAKGMTEEEAAKKAQDPLYLGCLMIKAGDADGELAGARGTTADTIRPAFQILKTKPGCSIVSGAFLMFTPAKHLGENGFLLFADCAVNPNPDAKQLAEIAISTAETARAIAGIEPRVAMLSFSTKGSKRQRNWQKRWHRTWRLMASCRRMQHWLRAWRRPKHRVALLPVRQTYSSSRICRQVTSATSSWSVSRAQTQ